MPISYAHLLSANPALYQVDDAVEDADDEKKGDDPDDIKHDRLIKEASGKKKAADTKGKGVARGKK